jgi:tetratricopeptide (TPR) repeat protein
MRIYQIITLIALVSCASGPKQNKSLENITKDDFKTVKSIRYSKKDDKLNSVKSEYTEVSNTESLQRIYKYDGDIELSGELGQIADFCYKGQYSDAYSIIKDVNKKYIKNPIFWNHVGTCYLLEGSRRKALLFLNKALSIKPNYAPSLNNLGVMYMYEKDYSRALVAFERARKSKEFSATPRLNLANLYLNFGLYDKSIIELKTLYSISKKDVDVLIMLGTAYLMKNDYKRAVDVFKTIDSDFTSEARVGLNFSVALYLMGKKEESHDIYSDINDKNLNEWDKYYQLVGSFIGAKND